MYCGAGKGAFGAVWSAEGSGRLRTGRGGCVSDRDAVADSVHE